MTNQVRHVSSWPSALQDEFASAEEDGALDAARLSVGPGVSPSVHPSVHLAGVTVPSETLASPMAEDPGVELADAVRLAISGRVRARRRAVAEVARQHRTVNPQGDPGAPSLAILEALDSDVLGRFQSALTAWSSGDRGARRKVRALAREVAALVQVLETGL